MLVASLGAFLRVFMLGGQVAWDDELHSVAAGITHSYAYLFSHFFSADVSTPQTLVLRLLAETVGISELTLRLLPVGAGLASLAILPWLARRTFSGATALIFAALLSVSQHLVYYSRYARPYAVVSLLVPVAVFSFLRWWESGGRGSRAAFVATASLAVYFHPLAGLAALSPFLTAIALVSLRGPAARDLRSLASLFAQTAAVLAILFVPPLRTSAGSVLDKAQLGSPDEATLAATLHLFAGTSSDAAMAAFWIAVALGVPAGFVRQPRATAFVVTAIATQMAGVWLARPHLVEISIVYARYCIGVLPLALLLAALSLSEPWRARSKAVRAGGALAAIALILAVVASGPLPTAYRPPNNFTNHTYLQPDGLPRPPLDRSSAPAFYLELARQPGDFSVVETPWFPHWQGNPFLRLQLVHRKEVFLGFSRPEGVRTVYNHPLDHPLLRFSRYLDLEDPGRVLESGARYVIVHRDLAAELGPIDSRHEVAPDVSRILDRYESDCGPPAHADDTIVAFALARCRLRAW